eukprot:16610-Heterococcus_DN1.PRE.12
MASLICADSITASPLEDAGMLVHVLNILGPGQHLFISAVSRVWRESYKRVASTQVLKLLYLHSEAADLCTITPCTTRFSAAFASAATLRLVHEHGLSFSNENFQRLAGRLLDVSTLQAAQQLGLRLTAHVLFGAAESASVFKLQWLHTEMGCPLPQSICGFAARTGSAALISWLKEYGCKFCTYTTASAAAGANLHLLQFLRDERCEWDETACAAAARNGHLATLKWLHEQGCPWIFDEICGEAAESGNIEMLLYLKQQGCEYNADTMRGAAGFGHLPLCEFLLAEQCPWTDTATGWAAWGGEISTLRWLRESGCPWNANTMLKLAAEGGSIEVMTYLQEQGVHASPSKLREMLSAAGANEQLAAAQWLRQQGAEWPAVLRMDGTSWQKDVLKWARAAGCTSPTI